MTDPDLLATIIVVLVDKHDEAPLHRKPVAISAQPCRQFTKKVPFALECMKFEGAFRRKKAHKQRPQECFHRRFFNQKNQVCRHLSVARDSGPSG